jgi:hypothetical protein
MVDDSFTRRGFTAAAVSAVLGGCISDSSGGRKQGSESASTTAYSTESDGNSSDPEEEEWRRIDQRLEQIEERVSEADESYSRLEDRYSGFLPGDSSQILDDYFALSDAGQVRETTSNEDLEIDSELFDDEVWYGPVEDVNSFRDAEPRSSDIVSDEAKRYREELKEKKLLIAKPALWKDETEREAIDVLDRFKSEERNSDLVEAEQGVERYEDVASELEGLRKSIEDKSKTGGYEERLERLGEIEGQVREACSGLYLVSEGLKIFQEELAGHREYLNETNTNLRFYMQSPNIKDGLVDFNRDGKVDQADVYEFALRKDNRFVQGLAPHLFDLNGDGKIDHRDVRSMQAAVDGERETVEDPLEVSIHYHSEREEDAARAMEVASNLGALINGGSQERQTKVEVAEQPTDIESGHWRGIYNKFKRRTSSSSADYNLFLSPHNPEDRRGGHSEIESGVREGKSASGVVFDDIEDSEVPLIGGGVSQGILHEAYHGLLDADHSESEFMPVQIEDGQYDFEALYATAMATGFDYEPHKDRVVLPTAIPSEEVR